MSLFFEIKVFEIKGVKYKMKKIKRESSVPNFLGEIIDAPVRTLFSPSLSMMARTRDVAKCVHVIRY